MLFHPSLYLDQPLFVRGDHAPGHYCENMAFGLYCNKQKIAIICIN